MDLLSVIIKLDPKYFKNPLRADIVSNNKRMFAPGTWIIIRQLLITTERKSDSRFHCGSSCSGNVVAELHTSQNTGLSGKKVREKSRECHNHKKGKRKVQKVPQLQTAALPRHQEEEETDKSKQAQIEQTYEKH